MISIKKGDDGAQEIAAWANAVATGVDRQVRVTVHDDHPDSNTFVVRLAKNSRVLVFRLSYGQIETEGREAECERTLKRKIKDLEHLI